VDHVALPDFAQGAMENLGCITYRESALLLDPDSSTHNEQLNVAETVAHELAHMWFGDLVTMRWWNGLWLNEAFATFMSMLAVDAYRPDWDVWNQFARSRTAALEVDSLESTRPIEYPVHSPDDANGMFDTWEEIASATASVATWRSTRTTTPRPTTCGTRSRRRPASPSGGSWTVGSGRVATR
jgi:puromycin-sensitive aminopeptidase